MSFSHDYTPMPSQPKPSVISPAANVRAMVERLQASVAKYAPDLMPAVNELFGMVKTYERVGEPEILEVIAIELGALMQRVLERQASNLPKTPPHNWKGLVDNFVGYMTTEKGLSESSVRIYRAAVKKQLGYQSTDTVDVAELLGRTNTLLSGYERCGDRDFRWQNRNNISALKLFFEFLSVVSAH